MPSGEGAGTDAGHGAPYPVVLFVSGFQARSHYYKAYAHFLASWGYVVVQYDAPWLRIIEDSTELAFLDGLLKKLRADSQAAASPLYQRLDLARLGVAGHSRGGKLAALHFARDQRIAAAYLLDPVDNTARTPESEAYPSAVKALVRCGRAIGISGAAQTGNCNPKDSTSRAFYQAAGNGSWLLVPACSCHTGFLDAGLLLNRALDCLCCAACGRGTASRQDTLALTRPALLAWLERRLRPDAPGGEAAQLEFAAWLRAQHAAGAVSFEFKGQPLPSAGVAGSSEELQGNIVSLAGQQQYPGQSETTGAEPQSERV
ncbi:hypothetical protein WJX81_004019 [Elliptochloris bilobata]|uniref:Chlorophyllase n=1 Tax=Elliptochloris bilobata TaxID=381761 RepID=A0AAW1QYX0_9CHLO